MSRRIFTYRVEDSADYILPGLHPDEVQGKTYFVIKDPHGFEIGHGLDMNSVRAFCNHMNILLELE